jgi:hypothetical protein
MRRKQELNLLPAPVIDDMILEELVALESVRLPLMIPRMQFLKGGKYCNGAISFPRRMNDYQLWLKGMYPCREVHILV